MSVVSLTSIISGLIAFGFIHLFGAVTASIAIYVIIKIAIGLETDKMFLRNIYNEIDGFRKDDTDINDKEIMMKIFESNFPEISDSVTERIMETSEDIEEMLLQAIEYENSGKLKKNNVLEDSDIL